MAEEIRSEIIVDISKAIPPLKVLNKQHKDNTATLKKDITVQQQWNVTARGIIAVRNKQSIAVKKSTEEVKKSTAATRTATAEAKRNVAELRKQIKSSKELGISWTSVKRIFTGQVIFRALSAITNQMRDSVGVAQELGISLAEAITIAPGDLNLSIEGIQTLGKEVKLLSESFGIDQVELASAAYQVYSNQIGNARESTKFLSDAVLFAKATVTNTANAVDLLAGVINSYGLEAKEASRVSDIFTKAVELGRFRIDDIANSMGRVNPIAAQLGISIEEVAAAFATLTIKGVSPDKAMTQLLATMLKLIKPSTTLSKALKSIGFSSIEEAIGARGLVGTLKDLVATTDGSSAAIGRLFPRVRAIQGVLGLVGDEGERFNSIFTEIQDTASGATAKFAEFILATDAEQFKRNIQAIKNLFIEDFGKPTIKIINELIAALGGVPKAIDNINKLLEVGAIATVALILFKLGGILITVKAAFIGGALAVGGFSAALAATPIILAALAGALIGIGIREFTQLIVDAIEPLKELTAQERELAESTKQLQNDLATSSDAHITGMTRLAEQQLDLGRKAIRELVREQQDAADEVEFIQDQVTGNLINQLGKRLKSFEQFAKDSANALELATKDIAKIDDSIAKIKSRSEQELFDLRIRNLSQWDQRVARARRTQNLLRRAAITTDKEERTELLRTAAAEASRARSPRLVKQVAVARIKDLEAQKSALKRNAIILQQMAPTIRKAAEEMKFFQETIKEAGEELKNAGLDQVKIDLAETKILINAELSKQTARQLEDDLGKEFGIAITSLEKKQGLDFGIEPIRLEFEFLKSFDKMEAALKSRTISIPVFLALAGILGSDGRVLTPDSSPEAADALISDLEKRLVAATIEVKSIIVKKLAPASEKAKQEIEVTLSKILASKEGISGIGVGARLVKIPVSDVIKKEAAKIQDALDDFIAAVSSKKVSAINETFTDLVDTLSQAKNIDASTLQNALKAISDIMQKANAQIRGIRAIKEIGENLQKAGKASKLLSDVGPAAAQSLVNIAIAATQGAIEVNRLSTAEREIGPAAQLGSSLAVNALSPIGSTAFSQVTGVNALAFALANLASQRAAAATVATGGQIPAFLAGGGPTQSRGTDTVPVQAAPGEMFINAASSRRFIPELNAINQGRAPEPRNNSQVTNNSFSGDININVPPGSKVDGRTIAQDIRRELRRKTSSLS